VRAPELIRFGPDGAVPNNAALPVVVMRGALGAEPTPKGVCSLFERNGWRGTWVWTVFDFHHYHPNAHEVLGVASGWADIRLGGPGGQTVRLGRGDVAVLPAGTGHCREATSADFAVCGGYPPGQERYETTRAGGSGKNDAARIAAVALPQTDPVFGPDGPLIAAWR